MKKYEIVKEHKEFDDILTNGSYYKNNYYIIYNKDSNYNFPRFGIAAGKKLGNAVIRNKIKRQVRMIISSNKNLTLSASETIISGGIRVDAIYTNVTHSGHTGTSESVSIKTGNNKIVTLKFEYGVCVSISVAEAK